MIDLHERTGMTTLPTYVLITPARNEAGFIEQTIRSVLSQTVLPLKWIIVSDGSTDGTDAIVSKYAKDHPWIELVRMPERGERHFAGKVYAFNAAYARVKDLEYDAISSLDADISFDENYFFFLLGKLTEDPTLGLVGTPFKEGSSPIYNYHFVNIEHVSGACQLFRRKCFEQVGGYVPVGWLHRSYCSDFREDEGLEDQDIYGKNLFSPSANGDGQGQCADGQVSEWPERLRHRKPSYLGVVPSGLPDDQEARRLRRLDVGVRLRLGADPASEEASLRRTGSVLQERADAATEEVFHRQQNGLRENRGGSSSVCLIQISRSFEGTISSR